jgi:nucleoside-diphosphate-sugar epimerase
MPLVYGMFTLARRVCGSLQIDISRTRDLMGWTPPVKVDEALGKTAESYINSKGN